MFGPLITLTTDFGVDSPYVAAMKGVILSINPAARPIDLTHAIPPQDVRQGALALAATTVWFPPGSLHIGVVDPGVGTARELLFAEIDGRGYLAPDNGLLSGLTRRHRPSEIRLLRERQFWLSEISSTFHGRDILSPVAARLSLGLATKELGPSVADSVELAWPEPCVAPGEIRGEIQHVDSFGNLVSNIERDLLPAGIPVESLRVECGPLRVAGLTTSYGHAAPGAAIALVGSSGLVELAIVDGNAARRYSLDVGAAVRITW